jgi:hypothetical protein
MLGMAGAGVNESPGRKWGVSSDRCGESAFLLRLGNVKILCLQLVSPNLEWGNVAINFFFVLLKFEW